MITADDARALMDRKFYEEQVKKYEKQIEAEIIQAAKNNDYFVRIALIDEFNSATEKALNDALLKFRDNGFDVISTWVESNKIIVSVSWE